MEIENKEQTISRIEEKLRKVPESAMTFIDGILTGIEYKNKEQENSSDTSNT